MQVPRFSESGVPRSLRVSDSLSRESRLGEPGYYYWTTHRPARFLYMSAPVFH